MKKNGKQMLGQGFKLYLYEKKKLILEKYILIRYLLIVRVKCVLDF